MIGLQHIQIVVLVVVLIANMLLALFVYKNNPGSATNKLYSILSFIISVWLAIISAATSLAFSDFALVLSRASIFVAAPMNLSFFLLAETLPDTRFRVSKRLLLFTLSATAAVMVLNISPYAFRDVVKETNTITVGWGFVPFVLLSIITTASAIYVLFRKIRRSERLVERHQLTFMTAGMFLMLTLLILVVLLPVAILNDYTFVPLAPLCVLAFLGMTAYAIIRHRFLDIRLLLFRAVSFLVASVLFAGVYSVAIFGIIHRYLLGFPSPYSFISSVIFTAVAILFFDPVKLTLQEKTNKFFFKGEYDKDTLLAGLAKIMSETIDLDILTEELLAILRQEMRLNSATFLIDGSGSLPVTGEGSDLSLSEAQLTVLGALFKPDAVLDEDAFVLIDELPEGPLREVFRETETLLAITIRVEGRKSAVLLLGSKLSGEIYNQRDIDFFAVFAPEVGISIQNAKSYTEIKNFSKKLEQRVIERTQELKEAQERELEKAHSVAKLKDEFVFVAAHELRTPITAIRGFLELVNDTKGAYPKDVQEDLDNIESASSHLNQLVNDLLEIARSESDVMKVQTEPVDIAAQLEAIVAEVGSLAAKKHVTVKIGSYQNGVKALADPAKLKEVLVNLVGNAIKYNRDNGLVEINTINTDNSIFIEVRDTGFGIPEDQAAKIFEKFFRASSEHTQGIIGTGLGLFITRMLVEKMGGSIVFTSVEGEGTTFSVQLPRA